MDWILPTLKWLNDYGLWNAVQTVILVGGSIVGARILWGARKRIEQLDFWAVTDGTPQFPKAVRLFVQNYTGTSVVVSSPYFRYRDLPAHRFAAAHGPAEEYQLKFPNPDGQLYSEVEVLLRHKETTHTLVPFADEVETDRLEGARKSRSLGTLTCNVTWLTKKPRTERLKFDI